MKKNGNSKKRGADVVAINKALGSADTVPPPPATNTDGVIAQLSNTIGDLKARQVQMTTEAQGLMVRCAEAERLAARLTEDLMDVANELGVTGEVHVRDLRTHVMAALHALRLMLEERKGMKASHVHDVRVAAQYLRDAGAEPGPGKVGSALALLDKVVAANPDVPGVANAQP